MVLQMVQCNDGELYEYSVIIMFILQQGETVAEAYFNSLIESVKDDLKPRTICMGQNGGLLEERKAD